MTDAVVSQVVAETLRTNLAPSAVVSQVVVEVLRPKGFFGTIAETVGASAGTPALAHSVVTAESVGAAADLALALGASISNAIVQRDIPFTAIAVTVAKGIGVLDEDWFSVAMAVYEDTIDQGVGFADSPFVATFAIVNDTIGVLVGSSFLQMAGVYDGVGFREVTLAGCVVRATDSMRVRDTVLPARTVAFADEAAFDEALAYDFRPGATISEGIGGRDAVNTSLIYQLALNERGALRERLTGGWPVSISQGVAVAEALSRNLAIVVAERLGLLETLVPSATLGVLVRQGVRLSDTLRRFLSADAVDGVEIAETFIYKYAFDRPINEQVRLSEALTPRLLLRILCADEIGVDAAGVLKMIFAGTVAEGFELAAAHVAPNGTVTTWAVNTRTGATTEYGNYEFNSFGQIGHRYLGTSRHGLYELNGDTDDGDLIIAQLRSGYAQFNGSRFTGFKAVYLGMRANGEFVLKLETGTGESTHYNVVAQDMQTTKVQVGKGLRARYFAFELISAGQDFDLDTIEFVPMPAQRRV